MWMEVAGNGLMEDEGSDDLTECYLNWLGNDD